MNLKILITFFFTLFSLNGKGFSQTKFYSYNVYDAKDYLFTMSQSNDLMLNMIRYVGGSINDKPLSAKEKKIYAMSLSVFSAFVGLPMTHEEGHRSVLSELEIGSINKPFMDKYLVAKVTGVSDETLINFRNNSLPNYIRLHTAGLESDYAYLKKSDAFLNFNEENYDVLYPDYLMRKIGTQFYYFSNLYSSKTRIKEQENPELERDIVGHDLYGMIRHLHRPTMEFYRYTERKDLTTEEISYAKRMGYKSLLNFINANVWKLGNFDLSKDIKANFSVSYSLAPFGDFVEQNVYLRIKDRYKINPYLREYFNKSNAFFAGGIKLHNYAFHGNKFLLNSSLDLWEQPRDLEFRTNDNEFGFGLKSEFSVRFSSFNNNTKSAYMNLGVSYKTDGFIPEVPSLYEDFGVHLGIVLSVNR